MSDLQLGKYFWLKRSIWYFYIKSYDVFGIRQTLPLQKQGKMNNQLIYE